jgi:flagellar FliJ protein
MNKTSRFESLKDLAGGREAGAARRLAESLDDMKTKQAKLKELRDYLDEYRQASEQRGAALDTARWENSRLFLSRLSDAVTLREGELEAAKERYRQEAERWRDSHRQTKALEKLVDKYYREGIRDAERRDQKELDEQASRRKD